MKVLVIGLGRIGLPHALVSASCGNMVYGYDSNSAVIEKLKNGTTTFYEPYMKSLLKNNLNKKFIPTDELKSIWSKINIILCCIGVDPINKKNDFNSFIRNTINNFCRLGLKNKLLILRTTLPIGSTVKIKEFIEKKTNLKSEKDFFIAYCPERMVEGKAIKEEFNNPVIIGSIGNKGFYLAKKYFSKITKKVFEVTDTNTAEFIKLLDNSYRSTMFAFSNDIAILAEKLNINIYEAIKVANRDYLRNNIKLPSFGVGGYCLTKDPLIFDLAFPKMKDRYLKSLFFYAKKINDHMPEYVAKKVVTLVKKYKKKKILICGITYKENVDDTRFSHGLNIAKRLKNFDITIYDPFIGKSYYVETDGFPYEININKAFKNKDCAVFVIKHKEFLNKKKISNLIRTMNKSPIIIDGWNIFPEFRTMKNIIYWGFG